MEKKDSHDLARLAALHKGDAAITTQFLKDISATVWTSCALLTEGETDAREAFVFVMEKLRAENFARLSGYTGHGALETFAALAARDILAERMLLFLQSAPENGWRAFARFFDGDIRKLIRRHFPGPSNEDIRRDAYQEVCVALIDAGYRRLKAYDGSGSFAGFVLRIVDRLLIDFMRSVVRRRRMPEAIARQGELDREVYELVFWRRIPQRSELLAAYLRPGTDGPVGIAEIEAALARVVAYAPAVPDGPQTVPLDAIVGASIEAADSSPEAQLIETDENKQLAAALAVLAHAVESLSPVERFYLTIMLGGSEPLPSREIARLMQRPVEEIYKLKQRVLKRLREVLTEESAVKIWRASV